MATPLSRADGPRPTKAAPYKYNDQLYITSAIGNLGQVRVAAVSFLVKMTPPEGEGTPPPVYQDIELQLPEADGYSVLGVVIPPFAASAIDVNNPEPDAADDRVVRPMALVRGSRTIDLYIIANETGDWPGATPGGTMQTPTQKFRADGKFGHPDDFYMGSPPPTDHHRRPNIVRRVENVSEEIGVTDPQTYKVHFTDGTATFVEVTLADYNNSLVPQQDVPWPLDVEGQQFGYEVLDIHEEQATVYPKRNTFPVPDKGPNPLHNQPLTSSQVAFDTVISVTEVQVVPTSDAPVTTEKLVSLQDGTQIKVPVATNVLIGRRWNGGSQSASDPVELQAQEIDPAEWWHFRAYVLLAKDNAGHVAGFHADPWPLFPNCVFQGEGEFEPLGGGGGGGGGEEEELEVL